MPRSSSPCDSSVRMKCPNEPRRGALIVSMTRRVEDLLIVYLLAREAGLMVQGEGGLVCPLPVAPLFETMADLAPTFLTDIADITRLFGEFIRDVLMALAPYAEEFSAGFCNFKVRFPGVPKGKIVRTVSAEANVRMCIYKCGKCCFFS